jgi:hypothetical protein
VIIWTQDNVPFLEDPEKIDREATYQKYLTERDYHAQVMEKMKLPVANADYWKTSSIVIAGRIFKNIKQTATRPFVTTIIYDKHETGRNRWKNSKDKTDARCELCGEEIENQQHILC